MSRRPSRIRRFAYLGKRMIGDTLAIIERISSRLYTDAISILEQLNIIQYFTIVVQYIKKYIENLDIIDRLGIGGWFHFSEEDLSITDDIKLWWKSFQTMTVSDVLNSFHMYLGNFTTTVEDVLTATSKLAESTVTIINSFFELTLRSLSTTLGMSDVISKLNWYRDEATIALGDVTKAISKLPETLSMTDNVIYGLKGLVDSFSISDAINKAGWYISETISTIDKALVHIAISESSLSVVGTIYLSIQDIADSFSFSEVVNKLGWNVDSSVSLSETVKTWLKGIADSLSVSDNIGLVLKSDTTLGTSDDIHDLGWGSDNTLTVIDGMDCTIQVPCCENCETCQQCDSPCYSCDAACDLECNPCYGCDSCNASCDLCDTCDGDCDNCDNCDISCYICDNCDGACYNCDTCDGSCFSCDTCDGGCDVDGCTSCDTKVVCSQSCDNLCETCDSCDECYVSCEICFTCENSCYALCQVCDECEWCNTAEGP